MLIKNCDTTKLMEAIRYELSTYGVLGNGYGGFISGKLDGRPLTFFAPKFDDLTGKEVRHLVQLTTTKLNTIKKETIPDDFDVEIISEPDEWGTHTQYLLLSQSRKEHIK